MLTVTVEKRDLIDKIISNNQVCMVGMIDVDGLPYVIPMNFGYADDTFYLHSAPVGRSVESLKLNPQVCITLCSDTKLVYQNEEVACSYRMKASSVICRGKVEFVDDFDEKIQVLNIIMKQYSDREFKYSNPAVVNVLVWKVEIDSISTKVFGVPHPYSRNYKDGSLF